MYPDPDPGGPKTGESCGSGSPTMISVNITVLINLILINAHTKV
jgi:hypothetical protein